MIFRSLRTLIYGILAILAILLSFRSFAPFHLVDLNSDQAIHVLMAYDLQLPQDLYFWGQNRLGSLVPILTHPVLKITALPPLTAISYVQYFVLIAGFLCLASLFQHPLSKLLFAFVWFLPLACFTELFRIAHPYSPQFLLLGLGIVLLNQIREKAELNHRLKNQACLALAILCLFGSFWISEQSIVFLFILLLIGLGTILAPKLMKSRSATPSEVLPTQSSTPAKPPFPPLITGLNIALTSLLGILFIVYAKQNATARSNYVSFSTAAQIREVLRRLLTSLFNTLTFQADNFFLSLHAVLALFLLISLTVVVLHRIRQGANPFRSPWLLLFAFSAPLSFILLILSSWLYRNEVSLRYFVVVYICCWMTILLLSENLQGRTRRLISVLLGLVVLASSLSLPSYVFAFEKPISTAEQLQDVKSLGEAGIIGEFWRSYIFCAVDPANLKCTPNDRRKEQIPCPISASKPRKVIKGVRCPRCARQVLQEQTIYLVKEDWLASFPAEIQQFGQCLVKIGDPKQIAGSTMAPYQAK